MRGLDFVPLNVQLIFVDRSLNEHRAMSCLYDKREKLQKALEIIIIPLLCWILLVLLTHTFYDPG